MNIPTFRKLSLVATLTAVIVIGGAVHAEIPQQPALPVYSLSSIGGFTLNPSSVATNDAISMYSVNTVPLAGFRPQVVMGLTDQWVTPQLGQIYGEGVQSSSPGGQTMPVGESPLYVLATVDTGGQSHILNYETAQAFDFPGANRDGYKTIEAVGAGGTTTLNVTSGVGVYATGLQNATGGSTLGVTSGTLRGSWNVPVATAQEDFPLPNILGAPIFAHWRVSIKNSQTRHITVGDTVHRGPSISFDPFPANPEDIPPGYSRRMVQSSINGPPPDPIFWNFDMWGAQNPDTPSFWTMPMTSANATHAGAVSNLDVLFDTGAQVSVLSKQTAADLGFKSEGPNPSVPDFYVDVLGVGGIISVPGFFLEQLVGVTLGVDMVWNHVPVLVLDLPDPRNPSDVLPGLLGMNLFTDRDLIVNLDIQTTGGMYIAFGPKITPQWLHTGGGAWSEDAKWSLGAPDMLDAPANFLGSITAPATITVDPVGFTIGRMKFDSPHGYTIAGTGTLRLQSFINPQAIIEVASGNHAISAPLELANDMAVTIAPGSIFALSNLVPTDAQITKQGGGTLVTGAVDAGGLAVDAGTVRIAAGSSASTLGGLSIAPGASLDLTDNKLRVVGGDLEQVHALVAGGYAGGNWNGSGISSSIAQSSSGRALGVAVDGSDVLVEFTYAGDANLDGLVNIADLSLLASNWQRGVSDGQTAYWFHGDFNYDGMVTIADLSILASNWQAGVSAAEAMSFAEALAMFDVFNGIVIPEPGSLGLLALGLLSLRRRRTPHPR